MDFHSLTRKELQTLCKKNKIPANMTNVAMADALKDLENVEGLDEIMNQSQSPERTTTKSSDVPPTATRTSTRKKPIKEEPESKQQSTRTRRVTKKQASEVLGQENKDENLIETPAVPTSRRRAPAAASTRRKIEAQMTDAGEEKSNLLETPAAQSGRTRPPMGSTRRQLESQKEESVQRVYSTRRSVRLLEKNLAMLNLKEKGTTEPVKIDDEEKDAESDSFPARNLSESMESEMELKTDVQENCKAGYEESDNLVDNHSATDAKREASVEETDESDISLVEHPENAADTNEQSMDVKANDAAAENSYEDDNADYIQPSDGFPVEVMNDTVSAEPIVTAVHVYDSTNGEKHVNPQKLEGKDSEVNVSREDHVNGDLQSILAPDDDYGKVSSEKQTPLEEVGSNICEEADEEDSAPVLPDVESAREPEVPEHALDSEKYDGNLYNVSGDTNVNHDSGSDESIVDDETMAAEQENVTVVDVAADCSFEDPVTEIESVSPVKSSVADYVIVDHGSSSDADDETNADEHELIDVADVTEDNSFEDKVNENENAAELIDVDIIETKECAVTSEGQTSLMNAPEFAVDDKISLSNNLQMCGNSEALVDNAEALVDVTVKVTEEFVMTTNGCHSSKDKTPTKQMSACLPLVCCGEVASAVPSLPLAAESSLANQFPRPTHSTQSKKQTTIQMIQSSEIHKENINSGERTVEPKMDEMKKNNDKLKDKFEGMSLRALKKQFKELKISNKEGAGKNVTQPLGKTRTALQALPDNCMPAGGEGEKGN